VRIKVGDEIAGWVAKKGQNVLLAGNLKDDPKFYRFAKKDGIKSAMSIPLKIEQTVIGVLNINSLHTEPQFTNDDLKFISLLANQAAIAIWHMRLHECAERAHRECLETRNQFVALEKLAALGELGRGIAHEINNPLAVISSNIQYLISETPKGCPGMEELNEIKEAQQRCSKIVERLGRYSRPSQYKGAPVNINSIIKEVMNLVEYQVSMQSIKIVEKLDPSLSKTIIDPDELKEVFLNIVLNAKYAMPKSGVLTIRARNIDMEKFILVEFTDTGYGIPDENINKIFDPFFTTRRPEGSGLGLSICQRIITDRNGSITVRSEVGKGTTFSIKLPAAQATK